MRHESNFAIYTSILTERQANQIAEQPNRLQGNVCVAIYGKPPLSVATRLVWGWDDECYTTNLRANDANSYLCFTF